MSAGAIIIIAISVTGILMMRFRKRWLAKFNIAVTNRITTLFAGWLPGSGILTHVGRKSGKVYRTPVNVFRAPNGFIVALTYSSQSEWVKNVLAADSCELKTVGRKYRLVAPNVVRDTTRRRFPIPESVLSTFAVFNIGICAIPFENFAGFIAQRAGTKKKPAKFAVEAAEAALCVERPYRIQSFPECFQHSWQVVWMNRNLPSPAQSLLCR